MFVIDRIIWSVFCYVCSWIGLFSMLTYVIVFCIEKIALRIPQNLKKKYNAEWAIVTGASSGIGKAIVEKLAMQNINVVLVSLDDNTLLNTYKTVMQQFPHVSFRKVGVDLTAKDYGYMSAIIAATDDINVNLVFNNAGYICTGLFADSELERLRCNLECNAGCAVPITHHFLRRMITRKAKGLITFTSSAACYLPGPTACLYSPSKAFLTNFATSIAAENRDLGIHVVVIHPSPVNTNFYKHEGPALTTLESAQKLSISPMKIANEIFAAAGRITVWDQGTHCFVMRLANKIIDFQLLSELIVRFAFLNNDHKKLAKTSQTRNECKYK